MKEYDTIIIGAGPAGLMCSACIDSGINTVILEKMPDAGRKLSISGSGQCNLTHNGDVQSFLKAYGQNGRFLKKALYNFPNSAVSDFFTKKGVALIEREDGKIFPASMRSADVIEALKKEIALKGHRIFTASPVLSVSHSEPDGPFEVTTRDETFISKTVVISTGGRSYPSTGSSGDGYRFAASLGHSISELSPALVPLTVKNWKMAELSGISFKNAVISMKKGTSKISRQGELLITHKGLSGPLVLDISRYLEMKDSVTVNFHGELNTEKAMEQISDIFSASPGAKASNTLYRIGIPQNFSTALIELAEIELSTLCGSVSKKQIRSISELLCMNMMEVMKGPFEAAMATSGGIELDEVDRSTMGSKIVKGLYFCGEVLDIDGDTGGYNIQAAFSTAYTAADDINRKFKEGSN
ncbi:MAG TPA: NAD(P)/FAD-dependent oxidoreductase [bacterium]|nr:NAD(P)/FAD-dependent oxidoreductase [bacterium]